MTILNTAGISQSHAITGIAAEWVIGPQMADRRMPNAIISKRRWTRRRPRPPNGLLAVCPELDHDGRILGDTEGQDVVSEEGLANVMSGLGLGSGAMIGQDPILNSKVAIERPRSSTSRLCHGARNGCFGENCRITNSPGT